MFRGSFAVETSYAVSRAAIVAYAAAIGETHPWCTDPEAARAAGHADVVAPPMFAAVYAMPAVKRLQSAPELALDGERLVHGAQRFAWTRTLVVAGDVIATALRLTDMRRRGALTFVEYETRSTNQASLPVCIGNWTAIVRDSEPAP
jgi:acyl dehydratase